MNFQMPKTLNYSSRQINLSGNGRAAGSYLYVDFCVGVTHEIFVAVVERTGAQYCLARVQGNEAMRLVRVDHSVAYGSRPASVGDLLLVGPLEYAATGPFARAAWTARLGDNGVDRTRQPSTNGVGGQPPRPSTNGTGGAPTRSGRDVGVIVEVAPVGTYGRIIAERTGRKVFVHRSQLQKGVALAVGQRVTYVEAPNDRGPTAYDVQPVR